MGLIPFVDFGMRVFAGFFVDVPEDDPVRSFARPLLDWVDGRAGFPPYQGVLDVTVALGLVWLASAFEMPRRSPIPSGLRKRATIVNAMAIPAAAGIGIGVSRLGRWWHCMHDLAAACLPSSSEISHSCDSGSAPRCGQCPRAGLASNRLQFG